MTYRKWSKLGGGTPSWDAITGKPTTFAPDAHGHAQGDVTGLSAALLGGNSVVTVPNNSMQWSEVVAAPLTGSENVVCQIASHLDAAENTAEMLDIASISATALASSIRFDLAFSSPQAGQISINWSVV